MQCSSIKRSVIDTASHFPESQYCLCVPGLQTLPSSVILPELYYRLLCLIIKRCSLRLKPNSWKSWHYDLIVPCITVE